MQLGPKELRRIKVAPITYITQWWSNGSVQDSQSCGFESHKCFIMGVYEIIFLKFLKHNYRSEMVNSNMVNSKFHLIQSFFEIFAKFLSFHV